MSWFSNNYEKALLAVSLLMAMGLIYLGWARLGQVDEDFAISLRGKGGSAIAVPGADLIPKGLQSMKLEREWTQASDADRPVDLFTGIALFVRNGESKAVDLLKDPPVHPPIPNLWWLEHRLDPGFANSASSDPDGDGFSNLEEFNAKTGPTDNKSYPELISKLRFVKDESLAWVLRPGYGDNGKYPFSFEDSKRQTNRIRAGEEIPPGELFFATGAMAKRFKLLGSEPRKEVNANTHVEIEVTIVRVEDQRPNKKGVVYELPSPLPEGRKHQFIQFDRTAVLALDAIGLAGSEFRVEENTRFALPPQAKEKAYLLKKVTREAITVEYKDPKGASQTLEIPQGRQARLSE